MAKLMTARRADTCADQDCTSTHIAAGAQINYGGPGAVTHAACKPMNATRSSGRRRSSRAGYASGFAARYGRCEDAPCCGCCD